MLRTKFMKFDARENKCFTLFFSVCVFAFYQYLPGEMMGKLNLRLYLITWF